MAVQSAPPDQPAAQTGEGIGVPRFKRRGTKSHYLLYDAADVDRRWAEREAEHAAVEASTRKAANALAAAFQKRTAELSAALAEKDAEIERLTTALALCAPALSAQSDENARLRLAISKTNDEVCQKLGSVLGYPRFCDDLKNFPTATLKDGVCVGEHVAESIASEATRTIQELNLRCEYLLRSVDSLELELKAQYTEVQRLKALNARVMQYRVDDAEIFNEVIRTLLLTLYQYTPEESLKIKIHEELDKAEKIIYMARIGKNAEGLLYASNYFMQIRATYDGVTVTYLEKDGELVDVRGDDLAHALTKAMTKVTE
jgi:uncharacterized coiled-coil protein SlyX